MKYSVEIAYNGGQKITLNFDRQDMVKDFFDRLKEAGSGHCVLTAQGETIPSAWISATNIDYINVHKLNS